MELLASVQPLVMTLEGYSCVFGEDDPEELVLLQLEDKEVANLISGVLQELYCAEINLAQPRDDEGLAEEVGDLDDLCELRRIAATSLDHTPDDYQEGRVEPGTLFNHLINHADDSGYYLPVEFPQAFVVQEISLGSSVTLLQELDTLAPILAEHFPSEMTLAATAPDDEDRAPISGPVGIWYSLRRLCKSSIETGLPIHLG